MSRNNVYRALDKLLFMELSSRFSFLFSQACRVNLNFPDSVCDYMMDKALYNVHCGEVLEREDSMNLAQDNVTNFITTTAAAVYWNDTFERDDRSHNISGFNRTHHEFEMEVCRAERESQKLGSTIASYIAPFGILS